MEHRISRKTPVFKPSLMRWPFVLTSQWEQHAVYGPLQKLAGNGVTIEVVPSGHDSPMDLAALEQSLSAKDVGLVAVTAACNVTGDVLPIERIIELSHQYDAMVLIDAAQIVGWVDLNLDQLGADMVAFGGHKGLQAPWGIGGLYVAASAELKCATAQCAIPDRNARANAQQWGGRPGYCDVGAVDQFSLAGLAASLDRLSDTNRLHDLEIAREQVWRLRKTAAWPVKRRGAAETSFARPLRYFACLGQSDREQSSDVMTISIDRRRRRCFETSHRSE